MNVINLDEIKVVNTEKSIFEQDYILEKYNNYESIFQSIKIENFQQLQRLIEQYKKMHKENNFIFRGQRNCHWKPLSSLEREININDYITKWHLENFRKLARGRIKEQFLLQNYYETEGIRELWSVGQHMGLKTPLLDWTYSLFVALYFAFEDKQQDNNSPYRSLYCLDTSIINIGSNYVNEVFEPISDPYGRLTAQQGLFITHRAIPKIRNILNKKNDQILNIKIARKYFISENLRQEIIDYLDFLGIKTGTIYPDLEGVIKKANDDLCLFLKQLGNKGN